MNLVPVDFEAKHIVEAMDGTTIREKVDNLEARLRACPPELVQDVPVTHRFAKGVYMRQVVLKAGTLAVGRIHKQSNLTMIMGDVSVVDEKGDSRVTGMTIFQSYPGARRVAYAHVDTLWITVHGTEETEVAKVEEELFAPDFESSGVIEVNGVTVLTGGF